MARTRKNGKEVNHQKRDTYKIRKRTSRVQRKNKKGKAKILPLSTVQSFGTHVAEGSYPGTLLKRLKLELWNRQTKQTRRWIRHVVESPSRGGMSKPVEQELLSYTKKSEEEQNEVSLRPKLSGEAGQFWRALHDERQDAMAAQGYNFEAEDWWVDANEGSGGTKKGRKTQMKSAVRDLNARMQELGVDGDDGEEEEEEGEEDENVENEEGGVPLAGVYSPIMLSPVRSPSLEEDFSGLNPLDS